jgi:hypothetical protein
VSVSGFGGGFQIGSAGDLGFNVGFSALIPVLVSQGLVLRYELGDPASYPGSGATVTDLRGSSAATLSNSPAYSSGYLTFNGTNQYLMTSTSLAAAVPTDVETISIWAYPMDNGVILSERGEPTLSSGWHNSTMEMVSGVMKFGMWQASGYSPIITSSVATPLNSWYNFTVVYNGAKLIAYVDGSNVGEATFSRLTAIEGGHGLFYAIAGPDTTNMGDGSYANMRMGQFLVYNSALSADQVLQNFNATRRRYGR